MSGAEYDINNPSTWPRPEETVPIANAMKAPAWAFDDESPRPAPAISGRRLLDQLADFLGLYVVFPSIAAHHAVALWIVHSHAIAAAESTPRLALLSAEKRSGKSRTLELLELLTAAPAMTASMSAAALFRQVEAVKPTLLMDEADTYFSRTRGGDDRNEELRAMLNAGHRRGAKAYRCTGMKMDQVKAYDPFCPVALAGIGDLPSTIVDRAIVVRMKRRSPGEPVKRFRRRKVTPQADTLRDAVAQWAEDHVEELKDSEPSLPEDLDDRAADAWEPLLAIADLAGGDWPARARAAALDLSGGKLAEDDTIGVRLLADCREVLNGRLSSADLASRLAAIEEAPWGTLFNGRPLDARGLAKRLQPYGIRPRKLRVGDVTFRGYDLADFTDAWTRYLPGTHIPPLQPEQPEQSRSEALFRVEQPPSGNGHVPDAKPLLSSDVPLVPAADPLTGPCAGCGRSTGHRDQHRQWSCSRCALDGTGAA